MEKKIKSVVFGNVLAIIVEGCEVINEDDIKWCFNRVFYPCIVSTIFLTHENTRIFYFPSIIIHVYNMQAINQRDNIRANNRNILEAWQNGTQSIYLQNLNGNNDVIHMVSIFQKKKKSFICANLITRSAEIYKEEENSLKWHGWMDRCQSCSRKSFPQSQLRWSMVLLLTVGCCTIDKRPLISSRW